MEEETVMNKKGSDLLWTTFCVLTGNALLAFLVAAFIIPHDIIMGGTTGIGIVLGKILHIDTANLILLMNIVLLLIGWWILGRKFFVTTAASSVLYPLMLKVMQRIPNIEHLTDNSLLATLFAGALLGISLGIVMRVGSSTGGMDVVSLILHKWTHLPIAVFVNACDFVIIGGQAIFSNPEKTMLGLVALIIETFVIEQVIIFGKSQIQIFVVSEHYEDIRKGLLREVEAGVTMALIETGALEKQQKGVICVIPSRKLYAASELIYAIDPSAFLTITKIKEVRGKGFTQARVPVNIDKIGGNV